MGLSSRVLYQTSNALASSPSSQDSSNSDCDSEGAPSSSVRSSDKISQPRPSAKRTQQADALRQMRSTRSTGRIANTGTDLHSSKDKAVSAHATGSMGKFKLERHLVPGTDGVSLEPVVLYASSDTSVSSVSPASSHRSAVSVDVPVALSSSTPFSLNGNLGLNGRSKTRSTESPNEPVNQPCQVGRIETWFARWPHRAAAVDTTVNPEGVYEDFNRIVNAVLD